ncbi:MAG: aminotransferase class I/II-fold pyridoxal phosphate-dependent enzyme [Magnetococcales bacterium]|nr:aminotransferase class I/II-fold pyridoxal phosphate-dependent enzyme [Magnetococcales bacterium]NGZ26240.1 aminotransferase class I/II-fold pyridoxal phosphate-dependent enzyme [Magnetococcales bacterium]
MKRWADKLQAIQPFHVMEVLQRVKELQTEGKDVVRLEVGEPEFATPPKVLQAAHAAIEQDLTRYTPSLGIPALRQKISQWYEQCHGVQVDPGRIIITPGASGAFLLAFGILLDERDRVAFSDPGYPCYPNMIRLLGGEPVAVPVEADDNYQLSPKKLDGVDNLRGVLITSPANPTGSLMSGESMAELSQWCRKRGIHRISDEIYQGITYTQKACSLLEFDDDAIVINGFSKFFAMTGWRLGWLIVPADAVRSVEILSQNLFIAASTLSQYAALAVFDEVDRLRQQVLCYDQNRQVLLAGLRELGFRIPVEPAGAFYIYADVKPLLDRLAIPSADELCHRLLEEALVAITPGRDFGQFRASEHVRLSYATDLERIQEGLRRMAQFLAKVG